MHAVTCLGLSDRMREEWTPKCRIYTLLSFFWVHLCYTWAAAAGDLLLGNHCVCPGAQRIGKEVGREVQWCFECYFGLASLKWGKKSAGMKWQFTLVALRKMGRKIQMGSKIHGVKKHFFLRLRSLIVFFDSMGWCKKHTLIFEQKKSMIKIPKLWWNTFP